MFIDDATFTRNGKTYRFNGQVCHDTLANLSHCSDDEIRAIWYLPLALSQPPGHHNCDEFEKSEIVGVRGKFFRNTMLRGQLSLLKPSL
jgi:hypothetical protein